MDDFNALFRQFERDGVWGTITFTLKEGRVVLSEMNHTYRTIADLKQGWSAPDPTISHKEEPGERHELHKNGHASAA